MSARLIAVLILRDAAGLTALGLFGAALIFWGVGLMGPLP